MIFRNVNSGTARRSRFKHVPVFALVLTLGVSLRAQTETQTTYAVLLDNTRSVEKQFPQMLLVGQRLIEQLRRRGKTSIFSFKPQRDESHFVALYGVDRYEGGNYDRAVATLGLDSTQDESGLLRYLAQAGIVKGNTDLFGAINVIADFLDSKLKVQPNHPLNRVMVLITDGDHRMDEATGLEQPTETDNERARIEKQLVRTVKERGIKVYAIGFTRDLDTTELFRKSRRLSAEDFLTKLTKETGGRVVFAAKSKNLDADRLVAELLKP